MNQAARQALTTIRQCIGKQRYRVRRHFTERMDEWGLFWPDVLVVIEDPAEVIGDGHDEHGRPRWLVRGSTADCLAVEIVIVFDTDDRGRVTVFITLYWTK